MGKGIIKILGANIIYLVLGLLTNFLLPKYVTMEAYAQIKSFTLYMTYAGFMSLGYNDSMYLRYGGKNLKDLDDREFASNICSYIAMLVGVGAILLAVALATKDQVLIAWVVALLPFNVISYIKFLYQATGEFDRYSRTLNADRIIIFACNMLLIFLFHYTGYLWYIWVQVLANLIVAVFLLISLNKSKNIISKIKIDIHQIVNNIRDGFTLMLGNLASSVFNGTGRWVVKLFMNSASFALYSFAATLEGFINTFTTPITITLYNYFCKGPSQETIKKIKQMLLLFGAVIIAAAFPVKFILEKYLTNYYASNMVVFILFSSQVFYLIVKGIYVNYYKAEKRQNEYLHQMLLMLLSSVVLNAIALWLIGRIEGVALSTLVTGIIWMIVCERKDKGIRFGIREYSTMALILMCYFVCGWKLDAIIGCITYIVGVFVIFTICLPGLLREVIQMAKYVGLSFR